MAGDTVITGEALVTKGETVLVLESQTSTLVTEGTQGPPGPPAEDDMVYAKRVDFVGDTVIYRGEAPVGTAASAPGWRIRRITISPDGDVLEEWAGGSANFNKVWTDRATYVFS